MISKVIKGFIRAVAFSTGVSVKALNLAFTIGLVGIMWMTLTVFTFFMYQLVVNKSFDRHENMIAYSDLPAFKTADATPDNTEIYEAPIKLNTIRGIFFCSATVISDRYALTAAHCLMQHSQPSDLQLGMAMSKEEIMVKDRNGVDTGIKATVAGVKISQDVGLIIGDFRQFKKYPVDFRPSGILPHHGPFFTCGFPGGDDYVCIPFQPQGQTAFQIGGVGYLYKGMSGGPVIDAGTNEVVVVNSRIMDRGVAVSPLVGLLVGLGIKAE